MGYKQILMSEERENKLRKEETSQFLKDLKEFQERSRNSRFLVKTFVA